MCIVVSLSAPYFYARIEPAVGTWENMDRSTPLIIWFVCSCAIPMMRKTWFRNLTCKPCGRSRVFAEKPVARGFLRLFGTRRSPGCAISARGLTAG